MAPPRRLGIAIALLATIALAHCGGSHGCNKCDKLEKRYLKRCVEKCSRLRDTLELNGCDARIPTPLGGSCDDVNTKCTGDLVCFNGICNREEEAGGDCTDVNSVCVEGLVCLDGTCNLPRSCADVAESGVYTLQVEDRTVQVFCDLSTDCEGCTVIHRRQNRSLDFNRSREDYLSSFGDPTGEFWLGLSNMHALTSSNQSSLSIRFNDTDNVMYEVSYNVFFVSDDSDHYTVYVEGFSGLEDEDLPPIDNCIVQIGSGDVWNIRCGGPPFNGVFRLFNDGHYPIIEAFQWPADDSILPFVEMKLKPRV